MMAPLQDGKWKPLVVMGGFATVDSNQLSVQRGWIGAGGVGVEPPGSQQLEVEDLDGTYIW